MAIRITMAIKGPAEIIAYLQQLRQQYPGAVAAAVYVEGVGIVRRARPEVPVDTSLLVNSEYCTLPSATAPDPVAKMGWAAPYALAVHERTEVKHRNGRAGWLRRAFEAAMAGYARRLLARSIAYVKQGVNAPSPDSQIPTEIPATEFLLKRVKNRLKRDKARTADEKARAYGKVQKLLDVHEQRQRARGVKV